MSYLRLTSEGRYCDLGDGSQVYAYGSGDKIINNGSGETVSYQEFAGAILRVFESVGAATDSLEENLKEEFGGVQKPDRYPYPDPEMGEIACRVVFDDLDKHSVERSVANRISAEFTPEFTNCENCGDRTRSLIGNPDTVYCSKDECREAKERKMEEMRAEELGYDSVEQYRRQH